MTRHFLSMGIVILSVQFQSLFAQPTFSKVILDDLLYECTVNSLVPAYDNGFILAGSVQDGGMVMQIDSGGNLLWTRRYNEGLVFNHIIRTRDSSFALVGNTNQGFAVCMKLNATGDTLWQTELEGTSFVSLYSIEETWDHGFIMAGYKGELTAPYSRVFVAKIDSAGNLHWSNYFAGGDNSNYGHSIHQVADSGYVVCGYIEDYPPFEPGALVLKLSPEGEIEWGEKIHNTSSPMVFLSTDFIVLNDGLLFYLDGGDLNASFFLVKTTFDGDISWSKGYKYLGSGSTAVNHSPLRIHSNKVGDHYFVHGSCWGSAIVKVDSLGNVLVAKEMDIASIDMTETSDGGFFIVGNGPMCGLKTNDYLIRQIGIIKSDSLGNAPDCALDDWNDSIVDSSLSASPVVFTESSDAISSAYETSISSVNMFVVDGCVAQGSGVIEEDKDELISIFPNPAHDMIYLESKTGIQSVELKNLSGTIIFSDHVNITGYHLDISGYPSGIYLLTIFQQDGPVKKLIVKQ